MWPESCSRSVRAADTVNRVKGTKGNLVVFGTLQDFLNKHDHAVTLPGQRRPQGAPAGPLNLFRYLRLTCPISNSISVPEEICSKATTQPIHHNKGLSCWKAKLCTYRKDSAPLKKNNSGTKLSFDSSS